MGILSGIRVAEFEAIGAAPFCGMLLADLGAEVILIERGHGDFAGAAAIFKRGKRSIALDLKSDSGRAIALDIVANVDALIEGMRPGVMERLGLGPDETRRRNEKLVYGRLTGWGQNGPRAARAGHDFNYVGLSGAAWYAGAPGGAPTPPPTLVGDVAGGALYLTIGVLAGIMRARQSGVGTVVDAAIVDGAAHMMNLLFALRAAGDLPDARGHSMLDGAHFYAAYSCADGAWLSVACLEPKFYQEFLQKMSLKTDDAFSSQNDRAQWPVLKQRLAKIFQTKSRREWLNLFDGTDCCVAPILSPSEAAEDAHLKARGVFRHINSALQAAPAPRFDGVAPDNPGPVAAAGQHTEEILGELGVDDRLIDAWRREGTR